MLFCTHLCSVYLQHGLYRLVDVPVICAQILEQKQVIRLKVNMFDFFTANKHKNRH